jgi:hypothetical protein
MRIRYSRRISNLLLLAAVVMFILMFLGYSKNEDWELNYIELFSATVILLTSTLMRIKPYAVLHDNLLIFFALASPIRRKIKFESKENFEFVKKRLYLHQGGKRKRIWISPNYVEPSDWTAFLKALNLDQ